MRLGVVKFSAEYVVDLDNSEMVEHARDAVFEDVTNAIKHGEVASWIKEVEDQNADEGDIPEFLLEDIEN
jgi:hypothetical protein